MISKEKLTELVLCKCYQLIDQRMRKKYPTDLIDEEWQVLEALVPAISPGGRPAD